MHRKALTLIELLLVIAIIGVLLALLLPAVQAARESSRRVRCASNLRELALGLHQYSDSFGALPCVTQNNYSLHVALLPFVEQGALYQKFDFSHNATEYFGPLQSVRIPVFECPSDGSSFVRTGGTYLAATNYHGNSGTGAQRYGYNGLFAYFSHPLGSVRYLPLAAISDGLSQTAMLSEVAAGNGTSHKLRCMWVLRGSTASDEFEQFSSDCRAATFALPTDTQLKSFHRGRPWTTVDLSWMIYNHVLPPNSPSCFSSQYAQHSVLSSTSMHPSVVNTSLADGSVHITGENIDITIWRQLGSRAGNP